jgi:hypothetical protein
LAFLDYGNSHFGYSVRLFKDKQTAEILTSKDSLNKHVNKERNFGLVTSSFPALRISPIVNNCMKYDYFNTQIYFPSGTFNAPGMESINMNVNHIGNIGGFIAALKSISINGHQYIIVGKGISIIIVNVDSSSSPKVVGMINSPSLITDLAVQGNYIYTACEKKGICIIDIAEPAKPSIVCSYNYNEYNDKCAPNKINVSGSNLYVTDGHSIYVLDISDIILPVRKSIYRSPYFDNYFRYHFFEIFISNQYMYVRFDANNKFYNDETGFEVIDLSNPDVLKNVCRYKIKEKIKAFFLDKEYAFIATNDIEVADKKNAKHLGLQIVDIANPHKPKLIKTIETIENPVYAIKFNNYIICAINDSSFQLIDVSVPKDAITAGIFSIPEKSNKIIAIPPNLYVLCTEGLSVLDFSNQNIIKKGHLLDEINVADKVLVSNNLLYVKTWGEKTSSISIFDITDPTKPVLNYKIGNCTDFCVSGNFLYLINRVNGLSVVDNSDPLNPKTCGKYIDKGFHDIAVNNNKVYIAKDSLRTSALKIDLFLTFDVSDCNKITKISSNAVFDKISTITINGKYAFISLDNYNRMEIFEISNLENFKKLGTIENECPINNIATIDTIAYVAGVNYCGSKLNSGSALRIINIANPQKPIYYENSIGLPHEAKSVIANEFYLLVADTYSGFAVIDYTKNPLACDGILCESFDNTVSVACKNNVVYVADSKAGLQIYQIIKKNSLK